MPLSQVTTFQNMAPIKRAEDDSRSDQVLVDDALADRIGDPVQLGNCEREEIGGEVEKGREGHRGNGLQEPRRDNRCDGVCCVMQPVQEVERQRNQDEADE